MGGVETSRGIAYQNAQAVLTALDVLVDNAAASLRIEGTDDIIDIEVLNAAGRLLRGRQIKTRVPNRTWGKAPILTALRRWLDLDLEDASFEFVTDGRLGDAATELQRALNDAASGSFQRLAVFLDVDVADPILVRLARASVREDVTGAEAVLALAEQEVRSLLPGARTDADLRSAARSAVDALLRDLANRAGNADPAERLLTKQQIAELVGGVRGVPASDRWTTAVRDEYLRHATGRAPDLVQMRLRDEDAALESSDLPLSDLLEAPVPVLLSGRTGAGKSSAAEVAVNIGAGAGQVVLVVHAEAYVATRLAALVAEALSEILNRPLPTLTGQQALSDPNVVLVVDGTSEIPLPMRQALGAELQPIVTSASAAHVVLVGRDRATLASLLPTSINPRRLTVVPLDHDRKIALVEHALASELGDLSQADRDRTIAEVVRKVERPLGDAAGSPMLFNMALQFAINGEEFDSDASLYAATISRVAERTGMTDVDMTSAGLGMVFAELLNAGRRFVYPHEYRRLLARSARMLAGGYFGVDEERLEANVRRSGLLVPLGTDQVLVPVHDSYADFLAGLAHARGLATLPDSLTKGDERRFEFAAQLGELSDEMAVQVCRDLPFLSVRVSVRDRRTVADEDMPQKVADALAELLPPGDNRVPAMWRSGGLVVVALVQHAEPAWIDPPPAGAPASSAPRVAVRPVEGALVAATRLWRIVLKTHLRGPRDLPARRPVSPEDAARLLRDHVTRRRQILRQLAATALNPNGAKQALDSLGALGIDATISTHRTDFTDFPIVYRPDEGIRVRVADDDEDDLLDHMRRSRQGHSSSAVEHLLRLDPRTDAGEILKRTIENMTEGAWLQ